MSNTFRIGGVHPHDNKAFSAHKQITAVPLPQKAIIPLVQHIGAPALMSLFYCCFLCSIFILESFTIFFLCMFIKQNKTIKTN